MAVFRRVYDSRHPQADCQEPGSAPEPYARQSSMGYFYLLPLHFETIFTKNGCVPREEAPLGGLTWACIFIQCIQYTMYCIIGDQPLLFDLHCVSKKQDTKLLPITSPNINRFSKFFHWQDGFKDCVTGRLRLTDRLIGKFATNSYLNIPPHLKYVATLLCEI